MKNISYYLLLIFISLGCKQEPKIVPQGVFDFLLGKWERTNETEGKETFEVWSRTDLKNYTGHCYTLKKGDTIWQEQMTLRKENTTWILNVAGPNETPIVFTVTTKGQDSFIAENPEHDFPKKIAYRYFDDTITASVSNEEMSIPFIFWRIDE